MHHSAAERSFSLPTEGPDAGLTSGAHLTGSCLRSRISWASLCRACSPGDCVKPLPQAKDSGEIKWCNTARGVNVRTGECDLLDKVVIKTRKALCAGHTFKTWKAGGKSDVTGQKCDESTND